MAIPTAITTQLSALNAAVAAAGDLDTAPFATINALAYQAGQLAGAIEAAIPAAAGGLDTWAWDGAPQDAASGVLGVLTASQDQTTLADLEGYVARISVNLENR